MGWVEEREGQKNERRLETIFSRGKREAKGEEMMG